MLKDFEGTTLHAAIYAKNLDMVLALYEAGADINIKNSVMIAASFFTHLLNL